MAKLVAKLLSRGANAALTDGVIDQRTRLVLFDHRIYNNEHNTFVSVRVSFQLQPWGFVRARVHARTMRLGPPHVRGLDVGLLVLDGLVYANVLISLITLSPAPSSNWCSCVETFSSQSSTETGTGTHARELGHR